MEVKSRMQNSSLAEKFGSLGRNLFGVKYFLRKHINRICIISCTLFLLFIFHPHLSVLESQATALLLNLNEMFIVGLDEVTLGWAVMLCPIPWMLLLFIHRKTYISSIWTLCLLLLPIVIYAYYRWSSPVFGFYYLCWKIAYTDMVFVPYALIILYTVYEGFIKRGRKIGQEPMYSYMLSDNAIRSADEDLFEWSRLAHRLLNDLSNINLSQGSFSLGINAPWGKGKTSFLNLIAERLRSEGDQNIVICFNPRCSKASSYIQEDFFHIFSKALAPYHFGFNLLVSRYVQVLGLLSDSFIKQGLFRLINLLSPIDDKELINRAIAKIGRRIYILLDDLDRLTGEELLEVFKIIGRNADFHHTIFLTAYDKSYVNGVLSQYLISTDQAYTDKYFAMEISLPEPQTSQLAYWGSQYISERIKEDEFVPKTEVLEAWKKQSDLIVSHLGSLRHIKRYINLFLSRYREVMQDVHCGDFFLVTLLRYRDPAMYNELSHERILTRGWGGFGSSELLYLRDGEETKDTIKKLSTWEYSQDILYQLFPILTKGTFIKIQDVYRRIRSVESFHLYFRDLVPGVAYCKDLHPLLDKEYNEAVVLLKELFDKEQRNRVRDFVHFELQNRTKTKDRLSRLILLSIYTELSHNSRWFAVWGMFFPDQAQEYVEEKLVSSIDEYKLMLEKVLELLTDDCPENIGNYIYLPLLDAWVKDETKKPIYSKEELLAKVVECQEKYYNRAGEENFCFNTAWQLAITRLEESGSYQELRRRHLFQLMKRYPDRFAKELIGMHKYSEESVSLGLKIDLDKVFPLSKVTFEDWCSLISDEKLRRIIQILHEKRFLYGDRQSLLKIPIDPNKEVDGINSIGTIDYVHTQLIEMYP